VRSEPTEAHTINQTAPTDVRTCTWQTERETGVRIRVRRSVNSFAVSWVKTITRRVMCTTFAMLLLLLLLLLNKMQTWMRVTVTDATIPVLYYLARSACLPGGLYISPMLLFIFFTARCYASAVYAVVVYLSVCLSVCVWLSHSGIVSKWLNIGLRK